MNIVITGANGQVGWELARSLQSLGNVYALDRSQADLACPEKLADTIAVFEPDVIVNAAAYTAVDRAETEETLASRVNGESVGVLAGIAKSLNALLIHYSTDYVFSGDSKEPCSESDAVSPLNAYGRTKLTGEREIEHSGCDYLIFRTSWVYAARGHNFLRTMLRLAETRSELGVVADQIGAPTWARTIADVSAIALHQALLRRRDGIFQSGTYHLTSRGKTSWHGFADAIFSYVRERYPEHILSIEQVKPITTQDYPTPAKRPASSQLNVSKLEKSFGLQLPDWQLAMSRCLDDLLDK